MPPNMLPNNRQASETGTAMSERILNGETTGFGLRMVLMRPLTPFLRTP